MKIHKLDIRIPYADVDKMGVVYYANYLVYFERGRTEYIRDSGYEYKKMEDKFKLFLPVTESHVRYFAPSYYDDIITVETRIDEIKRVFIRFTYEIKNKDNKLLVSGHTNHVCVNADWKPTRFPPDLFNEK
ncbi:MAG: thioesterase family protein [bacterium]